MLVAAGSLAAMGAAFGVVLGIAGKKFAVEVDPRVEQILVLTPGANCGACGLAGCAAFAEAVVAGEAKPGACVPGGAKLFEEISALLGGDMPNSSYEQRKVAQLMCQGGYEQAKIMYEYTGVRDCHIALANFKGPKACNFGCVRLGSCSQVCPFGAIQMGSDGLPVVDYYLCTGCNKCVEECPQHLFKLVGITHEVNVRCLNTDKGKGVRFACSTACIKCRLCEKNCPEDAVHVVPYGNGTVAMIDYEKCTNCGICAAKCPTKAIHKMSKLSQNLVMSVSAPKQSATGCQHCSVCNQ
jgi:Na+-translocating ferredoxin:NAD+ oxidoreductase subunit B